MYSPVLRNRRSEMLALMQVAASTRTHVMPLLDVAAPTKSVDKAKARQYVENNIARAAQAVKGMAGVFVDSSEMDLSFRLAGQLHPLAAAATAVEEVGLHAVPVTGLHRDAAHQAAAAAIRVAHPKGALCLRIDATDVTTSSLTVKRIGDFLHLQSLDSSQVHLLLDLRCLYGQDKDYWVKQTLRLLKLLDAQIWASMIVGGYGIPDQLATAVRTKDQGYLPRIEQDIFTQVAAQSLQSVPWFADYTIIPPAVIELDWRLIGKVMCPKALYTLDGSWFVVRGGPFSSHPEKYDQYYSIAKKIVALAEYAGATFSFGDQYIWERSKKQGTPGSPASWITACVSHHIALTAEAHAD